VIIRLYLDEDSSDTDLLRALRLRGVNVASAQEFGMRGQSDEKQVERASLEQRVVYTCNRGDFYRIHGEWMRQHQNHAGMILAPQHFSVGEQLRRLLRLIAARTAEEMRNRVEFLGTWGAER
jgi:Domain of unknown function (DUF5615)